MGIGEAGLESGAGGRLNSGVCGKLSVEQAASPAVLALLQVHSVHLEVESPVENWLVGGSSGWLVLAGRTLHWVRGNWAAQPSCPVDCCPVALEQALGNSQVEPNCAQLAVVPRGTNVAVLAVELMGRVPLLDGT